MISTVVIYKNFAIASDDLLVKILGFIGLMQHLGKTNGDADSWVTGGHLAVKRTWADFDTAKNYINLLCSIYPKDSIYTEIIP